MFNVFLNLSKASAVEVGKKRSSIANRILETTQMPRLETQFLWRRPSHEIPDTTLVA